MKFLHTSDWQIGMKAESVGSKGDQVREERLNAAGRVVQAAIEHSAEFILLTGDVFEDNAVDRLLVRRVGDMLGRFTGHTYIIPGNHDPLLPGSVWDHIVWKSATNITILSKSEPVQLDSCTLFPCPLHEKYSTKNPTSWISAKAETKIAIGMAHGTVLGIQGAENDYPIPRNAATALGLDYLAIGHWHSFSRYDDPAGICRMAYSGTHETTKFGERDSGKAILVEISARGATPTLTPIPTGGLDWLAIDQPISQPGSLKHLIQRLTQLPKPASTLVRVRLTGILFPEDRSDLRQIEEILGSGFLFGTLDSNSLRPAPDGVGWISSLPAGPIRDAAEKLQAIASHPGGTDQQSAASQALLQLFDLHERNNP